MWASSDHWSAASSALSGWAAEKIPPNCRRNPNSVVRRAARGPKRLSSSFCPQSRLARSRTRLALNSSAERRRKRELPSMSRARISVATELPMSCETIVTGSSPNRAASASTRSAWIRSE